MIPIPERMQHLKTWRGVAVPFMVVWKGDKPLFSINDEDKQESAPRLNLCSVCGTSLFRGRWFVGGPLSAFHPAGSFHDFAMHAECMRYSLQVCPYLALPKYSAQGVGPALIEQHGPAIGRKALPQEILNTPETIRLVNTPEVFVAVMTTKIVEVSASNGAFKPGRPYSRVEYWRHGAQLPTNVGEQLVAAALREFKP
jgi:hypothetical protein